MGGVAFFAVPTPLLAAASLVLGIAIGATAALTYIKKTNRREFSPRRRSLRHAGFASSFSNDDGKDGAASSSKRHLQQEEIIGGQKRRVSRRLNSGVDVHPGLFSMKSYAAQRIGQNSRSSSISLILKSCLGAESLGTESQEDRDDGDAEEGKEEKDTEFPISAVGSEEEGTRAFLPSTKGSGEKKGGNVQNVFFTSGEAEFSSLSTLEGLFSEDDASSQDKNEEEGQQDEQHSNNPKQNEDAYTTKQGETATGFLGRSGRSYSVNCILDRAAFSGLDFPGGSKRFGASQNDAVFSKRHFYHTHSGAIITRLPSVAAVRCRSILQLLHPPSSTHKDESTEEDGNLSQLTQSIRSTRSLMDDPIYRVVITGGPCSGKTSCLSYLRRVFEKLNFNVFCVPEVATLLHSGGVNLILSTSEERITQQRVILQMMMMLEDAFYELASMRSRPSLILYDRGTMDGSAYCSDEEWDAILKITGYTNEELSDARYDAVVHLVTAAIGAEQFYTIENNAARSEGLEDARRLDAMTLNAWRGHYLVSVVHNEDTDFEKKMLRVAEFIGFVTGVSTLEENATESVAPKKTAKSAGEATITTATPEALSSEAQTTKSPSLPTPFFLQQLTTVLSPHDQKGGEERDGEDEVAHMAFLATGTRAFANSASMATVSAHSLCNNNTNNNTNDNSICSPLTPPDFVTQCGGGELGRTSASSSPSHAFAMDMHAERGGLQRHFFVNRVDLAQIPADAVVANVVTITLVPLRANYRTEVIIRLSRANDSHPLYLRRVEYQNPEQTTSPPDDCEHELKGHRPGRHLTRVKITKSAFLELARRRNLSEPVIQKSTKRFFYNMRHFTLVTFQHPRELRGVCRLVAPADTTEEDIGSLADVEPFSLLMREGVM
ncbi:hypothetical protein TcYC6_0100320 [Trypanosoma cruzi]|nr:hypothetical protein TcYC6_0100320 [Trypanosoma cruzi]